MKIFAQLVLVFLNVCSQSQVIPNFKSGKTCCLQDNFRCFEVSINSSSVTYWPKSKDKAKNKRIEYVVDHLNHVRTVYDLPDRTFYIYTADTIPNCAAGKNIFVHSSSADNVNKTLLYPTPYLLRDRMNGKLSNALQKFCFNKTVPFYQKNGTRLFFRGKVRSPFRLYVAMISQKNQDTMDVKFAPTKYPLENSRNIWVQWKEKYHQLAEPSDKNKLMLFSDSYSSWENKENHRFLLHLNGAASSQWESYVDYMSGGFIFRHLNDSLEYWNADWVNQNGVTALYKDANMLPLIVKLYSTANGLGRAAKKASVSQKKTCLLLQPEKIDKFCANALLNYK